MASNKPDMSCARVKQYKSSNIGAPERHNERKNSSYDNLNVVPERSPYNIHFKDPGGESYMDILRRMEEEGMVSTRGLRQDATLFDEVVIDVNTMYFENHGGYDYAKEFYETAFHFCEEKFGRDNVISAVMHADELNKAATDELGKPVYHYHLHVIALPVVDKEIRWSRRCKDPALAGTVKEVVHQISHSKKWASDKPMLDEQGEPVLRKNGKPRFIPSYSVLQDELFDYMRDHGYRDFQRGERGSTTENLKSLDYQIMKDKERLAALEEKIEKAQVKYEPAAEVHKTVQEIENTGKKHTFSDKLTVEKEDLEQLKALAKEGITSRGEIDRLNKDVSYFRRRYYDSQYALDNLRDKYEELAELCRPFLDALEHFPDLVKHFIEKVKSLFEERAAERRETREHRRSSMDWDER